MSIIARRLFSASESSASAATDERALLFVMRLGGGGVSSSSSDTMRFLRSLMSGGAGTGVAFFSFPRGVGLSSASETAGGATLRLTPRYRYGEHKRLAVEVSSNRPCRRPWATRH